MNDPNVDLDINQGEKGPIPGLTEGRIVHFIPGAAIGFHYPDRHIPAIVVRVWDHVHGTVNLRLFLDGANDYHMGDYHDAEWVTSVGYDPSGMAARSWHFPERA